MPCRRLPSVVVLIYHRVGGRTPSPVDLPTATFERQLEHLAAAGDVIDLDAASALLTSRDGSGASRPKVVLTFDDGTSDWPDVVLPALAERGLPATFFVATDFVERGSMLPDDGHAVTWSGLADMVASGLATIGSHTHTHRVLARATATEAADQVGRSVGLIEERLAQPCRHFAYPNAIAPSAAAEIIVRRCFTTAALAGNAVNVAGATDLHRLGRHALTIRDSEASFARKAAGGMRIEGWLRAQRDATVERTRAAMAST